ncbi:MAG TPA: peptide-methionine (R)-S-oxide reductase MsrB [Gammaproteobacteria bacterium]|nr:peptide-methionine (R)-S-oxide reductase MsrB [Gammaproteobacteria bacterium]
MQRRTVISQMVAAALVPALVPFPLRAVRAQSPLSAPQGGLRASHERWREILPADRYRVLFEEATEPPRSNPLDKEYGDGTYVCAACYQPLFDSKDKFDSGTGWPSFTRPLEGAMNTKRDFRLIWPRTEYHCSRCGGHQGHVFDDGPPPTGQRWCNNGLALEFVPRGEDLPALRDPG